MSQSDVEVLIVGAGLTGLSAALHLGDRPYRLVDREPEVGGLCRSIREQGYTFDHTGHLLHLRRPEIRDLILSLIGEDAFLRIDRRSGVHSHGVFTDYPFQVNTHGLPKSVVRECVMGFAETLGGRHSTPPEDLTFHEWILATFGPGIARHFMIPYNEKLFCSDLDTVSADWVSWSIPKPEWSDVVRGALGTNRKAFGYNPQFLYPKDGGIDHLPRALLGRVQMPTLSVSLSRVDAQRRVAVFSNGEQIRYEKLISTIPLPSLLERIDGAPLEICSSAGRLRHVSVLNLNLGFDAPSPLPYHWVYFADPSLPFYRVGIYSNLCPSSVPEGHSAFYVEVSHRAGHATDSAGLAGACAGHLRRLGLVPKGAALDCIRAIDIPVAYVIHDRVRRELLPRLQAYLTAQGILSVGRYGAWEYSAMEDALWHGRMAAAAIG